MRDGVIEVPDLLKGGMDVDTILSV
jgi:hypothetical protein